jgi:hypothetical protein
MDSHTWVSTRTEQCHTMSHSRDVAVLRRVLSYLFKYGGGNSWLSIQRRPVLLSIHSLSREGSSQRHPLAIALIRHSTPSPRTERYPPISSKCISRQMPSVYESIISDHLYRERHSRRLRSRCCHTSFGESVGFHCRGSFDGESVITICEPYR